MRNERLTTFNYRGRAKDAWPDFLPGSDFYEGATNVKGHEMQAERVKVLVAGCMQRDSHEAIPGACID